LRKSRRLERNALGVGVILGLVVFIGLTQAYGIPFWWLFSSIIPLSEVQPAMMTITVSPDNPSNLGQQEVVSVQDSGTRQPIAGVNVTIYYGGTSVFEVQTDRAGRATFSYAGSPTIIRLEKSGYTPMMRVLPNAPEQWVNGSYYSLGGGVFAGIMPLVVLLLQRTLDRKSPAKREKKHR
jgi:hypothetical protein